MFFPSFNDTICQSLYWHSRSILNWKSLFVLPRWEKLFYQAKLVVQFLSLRCSNFFLYWFNSKDIENDDDTVHTPRVVYKSLFNKEKEVSLGCVTSIIVHFFFRSAISFDSLEDTKKNCSSSLAFEFVRMKERREQIVTVIICVYFHRKKIFFF